MNNTTRITRTAIVIMLACVGWLIALGAGTDIDTDIQPRTVASSCPLSMSFAVGGFTDPFATPRPPHGEPGCCRMTTNPSEVVIQEVSTYAGTSWI